VKWKPNWRSWLEFNPRNCLVFVLQQIILHPTGYVIIRRSDSGWYVHCLFSLNLHDFWEYLPRHRSTSWWVKIMPPIFYDGMMRHTTSDNLKRRKFEYTPGVEISHRDFKGYY
jgi:hypothetical protein